MQRFEKIKELGRGATGTVYKAFDNDTGQLVALKIPEPPPIGIDIVTHYKRETDLISGLNHGGVVKVLAFDFSSATPWLTYEFLKGHTLRELITSGKKFESDESVRIVSEIAHALAYIHDSGLVHRDINPNNVMITTDGVVKIMDFGIAHRMGEPFPKQLAGTPGYMSPETAKGDEGGPESDIYSLGVILYELLCGEPAYSGESVAEVIAKVINNDFFDLRQKKQGLSQKIYDIVTKTLAKLPVERYQSAGQLARDLDSLISIPQKPNITETKTASVELKPPHLIGLAGPYKGYDLVIGATITTIGGEYADIDLSLDPGISPQHCWIVPEDGGIWLYDAEDSGGTYLGGRAIKKARLISSDRITIGQSTFKWDYPSDPSPSHRNPDDIEYSTVPQRKVSSTGKSLKSQQAGMSPLVRTITGTVIAILIIYCFWGYFLLPRGEATTIALELENYWSDFNTLLASADVQSNIDQIKARTSDFTWDNLENMQLTSSLFFKLPGPAQIRANNLKKIDIAIQTSDALNILRGTETASAKKIKIDTITKTLTTIVLPQIDDWETRRNWLINRLIQISTQLGVIAAAETALGTAMISSSGVVNPALEDFLDGYFVFMEANQAPSKDVALQIFDNFNNSYDKSKAVLEKTPDDNIAKILVILDNYLMVKLRVDHTTTWQQGYVEDSVARLTEGRTTLDSMTDVLYDSNVPAMIEDPGYRTYRRIRAKYVTLTDQFVQKTGATVP